MVHFASGCLFPPSHVAQFPTQHHIETFCISRSHKAMSQMSSSVVEVWQAEDADPLVHLQVNHHFISCCAFRVCVEKGGFMCKTQVGSTNNCSQMHEHVWLSCVPIVFWLHFCSRWSCACCLHLRGEISGHIHGCVVPRVCTCWSCRTSLITLCEVKSRAGGHLPCGSSLLSFVRGVHCGVQSVHTERVLHFFPACYFNSILL